MTTHPSILAWKIPWREEPGGLQSWGCKELDMTEYTQMHTDYLYIHICVCVCISVYTCICICLRICRYI